MFWFIQGFSGMFCGMFCGMFLNVLGYSWMFLDVLDVLGCSVGCSVGCFRMFWDVLGRSGTFWDVLISVQLCSIVKLTFRLGSIKSI